MKCDICGKSGARIRHISRSFGHGADLLVIEKVPAVTCPHCGGSYLTAETLHESRRAGFCAFAVSPAPLRTIIGYSSV